MPAGLLFGQTASLEACVCCIACPNVEQQVGLVFSGVAACPGWTFDLPDGAYLLTFADGVWSLPVPDSPGGLYINFQCDEDGWDVGVYPDLFATNLMSFDGLTAPNINTCGSGQSGTVTWSIAS